MKACMQPLSRDPYRQALGIGFAAIVFAACSPKAQPPPLSVAAAAPPKDDGSASEGGDGGKEHAAALEQLKTAKLVYRDDKAGSIRIALPDGANWTRVRFWGVQSLVGFRYGKGHHAIAGAFVTHVKDNQVQHACEKSFEEWAAPWISLFEVELSHEPAQAFAWRNPRDPKASAAIIPVDALLAKTATVTQRESYVAAWLAYPVWDNACLIFGVAVPARGDDARAKSARDRFVQEAFPSLEVLATTEPKERF
jgi:hypothetical protein